MLSAEVMRRTLALAVLIAIALPIAAPVLEAATSHCGTVSSCCAPVGDQCGMTMCASEPAPAVPVVRATTVDVAMLDVVETITTIESPRTQHHAAPSPPPPTRVRLARLETLLI